MFSFHSYGQGENTLMWLATLRFGKQMTLWKRIYFAAAVAAAIFLAVSLF